MPELEKSLINPIFLSSPVSLPMKRTMHKNKQYPEGS